MPRHWPGDSRVHFLSQVFIPILRSLGLPSNWKDMPTQSPSPHAQCWVGEIHLTSDPLKSRPVCPPRPPRA